MKSWIKWAGLSIAVVALFYFGVSFKDQLGKALPLIIEPRNAVWCFLGALAVAPQLACAALAWHRILKCLDQYVAPIAAIRIVFVSQFARYVPGNVGHHIGKLVLARAEGISVKNGAVSIIIESVLVLLLGLAISAIFLPKQLIALFEVQVWGWFAAGAFILAVIAVLLAVKYGSKVLIAQDLVNTFWKGWRTKLVLLCEVLFYYVINFVFIGGLAWLLATQVFVSYELSLIQLTSIMAFSWTVGFLAPGAPAGLGVREVISITLLSASYDAEVAAGIVLLHRLVLTLGDLFTLGLGMILKPHKLTGHS